MKYLAFKLFLVLIIGFFSVEELKADTWESPSVKEYYSANGNYMLRVIPKQTSEKFHQWKYYTNNKHPQTRKLLRKKEKFLKSINSQDTIVIPCIAELYKINGKMRNLIWKRELLNQICPVSALVSNNGSSVVTFDNWYSKGYGVNVFVVYNQNGDAKATYKLEEISPFPLNDHLRSISSIHWRKDAKYLDNKLISIKFFADDGREEIKIYDAKNYKFIINAL